MALAMAFGWATAGTAQAQSDFGCRNLETHGALPAIEGTDGVFFRLRPDLQNFQSLTGQTITQMGALSRALAGRGTTLVLLPVPARAQVLGAHLPVSADFTGFTPDLAGAVQTELYEELRAQGVVIADPTQALKRAQNAGQQVFFRADPRPTPAGSRIMAQVVAEALAAHPDAGQLPRATFNTAQAADSVTLPSAMRAKLQLACQDALPPVVAQQFLTAGDVSSNAGSAGVVAVIGTEMTGTPALNFAGFLSEFSGLRAGAYGVPQGGAYAAISSYLTSVDYAQAPPQVLVWEVPVWEPFGLWGDQPMAELTAAAAQNCPIGLTLTGSPGATRLSADLSALPSDQPLVLSLNAGGVEAQKVTFHFTSADGLIRSRSIYRNPDQILTGQFYLPLSGLEATGLRRVDVDLAEGFGTAPQLSACAQGGL